jgi:hypothetical protein
MGVSAVELSRRNEGMKLCGVRKDRKRLMFNCLMVKEWRNVTCRNTLPNRVHSFLVAERLIYMLIGYSLKYAWIPALRIVQNLNS